MKLDIEKWNKIRKELEAQIKATKYAIRRQEKPVQKFGKMPDGNFGWFKTGEMYRGGTYEEYQSLEHMKWDATTLYAVRAACHGKQHCEQWTKEEALEKILPQYATPEQE